MSEDQFLGTTNHIYRKRFGDLLDALRFLKDEHENGNPPYTGVHVDLFYTFWQWKGRIK